MHNIFSYRIHVTDKYLSEYHKMDHCHRSSYDAALLMYYINYLSGCSRIRVVVVADII